MSDLNDEELRALLPGMRRFAASLTRDASAADDLVQSCPEKTLSRWQTKRPEGSLKAWLYAISVRQFLDGRRRAGRVRRLLEAFGVRAEDGRPGEETVIARFRQLGASDKPRRIIARSARWSRSRASPPGGGAGPRRADRHGDVAPLRARRAYRALTEAQPAPPGSGGSNEP